MPDTFVKVVPPHYNVGIEPFVFIRDWKLDFFHGNVLKYLTRYSKKGEKKEDLIKALVYINECNSQESGFILPGAILLHDYCVSHKLPEEIERILEAALFMNEYELAANYLKRFIEQQYTE